MQGRSMMGKTAASMMDLFPISTEEVAVRDEMVGLSEYNSENVRYKTLFINFLSKFLDQVERMI
jgi:hypothetical protein